MAQSVSIPKIILDTDPGGDDILALLWLLSLAKQGLVELVAVTTAAGNVSAQKTFGSASQILGLTGLPQIEVGRGVPVATTEDAAYIHGTDGMGGLSETLPPPSHDYETARQADDLMIDRLSRAPGEMTVVAIAPLTNLAAAEQKCPGILQKAREIVIMGGAFYHRGNVTAQAEFNLWFNPEATHTVLHSRNDLVIMPLDVTARLIFTREMLLSQVKASTALSDFLVALVEFMISTALAYRETNGVPGFLVHDAVTVSYLFYPEVLRFKRARVQVETQGDGTRGQTWMDDRGLAKPPPNAWVALQVDETAFFTRFLEDLKWLVAHE